VVQQEHPVTERELAADGTVRNAAVALWVDAAWQAYLDHCPVLQQTRERAGLALRHRTGTLPAGALLGRPTSVVVSASTTEFRPSSFTISLRLRPRGVDHDVALNATTVIHLEDATTGAVAELGDEVRDELIALEHSARYFN
jgi:acyl-CoA thioesterase FadM